MQPSAAGGSSSSGGSGGGELRRSGLARFRSAPATWLEALLEEEEEDPLKPNQCLTQLLSSGGVGVGVSSGGGGDPNLSQFEQANFQRQNSSPADLFDGYYSNFGIPSSYDYLSPTIDVSPSSKRTREDDSQHQQPSPKFPSHPIHRDWLILSGVCMLDPIVEELESCPPVVVEANGGARGGLLCDWKRQRLGGRWRLDWTALVMAVEELDGGTGLWRAAARVLCGGWKKRT